jgi:S-adenosylmethionine hydrolase
VDITSPGVIRRDPSSTVHGRDVFAPAAAHLAMGMPLEALGSAVDPSSLVSVPAPRSEVGLGLLRTEVLGADRFGNVRLWARGEDLAKAGLTGQVQLRSAALRDPVAAEVVSTFADLREEPAVGVLVDSMGRVALVRFAESAAGHLGLAEGDPVELRAE